MAKDAMYKINSKEKNNKNDITNSLNFLEKINRGDFNITLQTPVVSNDTIKEKKKTTRRKSTPTPPSEDGKNENLPMYQSTVPYKTEYEETDMLLRSTIAQIDELSVDIKNDIYNIKDSKTMRNKYTYLTNLYGSYGNVLSTKIAAVKEMNSITTKAVELDLKRAKENKAVLNVDDDKAVMDIYKTIIGIPSDDPMSRYSTPMPTVQMSPQMYNHQVVGADEDAIYNNYVNNMTPEQKMMRYEDDPNIKTVVIYDKSTYEKRFAVMNVATGEEITGVPVRSTAMFMPDTTIDEARGIARNTNLNETYPLIIVGNDSVNSYY